MRGLAKMVVIHPADAWELEQVLTFATEYKGPMYIRVARDPVQRFIPDNYKFKLGKAVNLKEGSDLTLMVYGELIPDTLEAREILKNKGYTSRIINMSSIKPVDEDAVIKAAKETGIIVTIDNHNIYGGLGSAVAEVVSENYPVPVKRIGVRDVFGKSGSNEEMKKYFGLRAEDIAEQALSFIKKVGE